LLRRKKKNPIFRMMSLLKILNQKRKKMKLRRKRKRRRERFGPS